MKKKKIIIIFITLILVMGCLSLFIMRNLDNKNNSVSNKDENKEVIKDVESGDNEENINKENKLVLSESYKMEVGSNYPAITEFVDKKIDATIKILFENKEISGNLDKIGNYELIITYNNKEYKSTIIVSDTKKPVVVLKDVTIKYGESYNAEKFVKKVEDSSEYTISFVDEKMSKYKNSGKYVVEIKVVDKYGNETRDKVNLIIEESVTKPSTKPSAGPTTKPETDNKPSNSGNSDSNDKDNSESNEKIEVSREYKTVTTPEDHYGAVVNFNESYFLVTYNDGTTGKVGYNSYYQLVNYSNIRTSTSEMLPEAKKISSQYKKKRQEMVACINRYRAEEGVQPVVLDETLSEAATIRGLEVAYTQVAFKHNRPDGRLYNTVIDEVYGKVYTHGENVAAGGFESAESGCAAFKSSPGHYTNMIYPAFTKVGIGYVYKPFKPLGLEYHWVQIFIG